MKAFNKLKNRFRRLRLKTRFTRPVIRIERNVDWEFIRKGFVPVVSSRSKK